jgi:hypothetical protein
LLAFAALSSQSAFACEPFSSSAPKYSIKGNYTWSPWKSSMRGPNAVICYSKTGLANRYLSVGESGIPQEKLYPGDCAAVALNAALKVKVIAESGFINSPTDLSLVEFCISQ